MDKTNDAVIKKFVKNKYGILIVKCCASCKYHDFKGDETKRFCSQTGKTHRSDFLCANGWRLSENLENAGKGGGKVKKLSYLRHVLEHGK